MGRWSYGIGDLHGNQLTATVLRGADALVKTIRELNVKHVFGIQGGSIMTIYDAFYNVDDVKLFTFKHEQGAIHAADAYARVLKRPGVVMVTSGPGATNLVTGLANAYMDSSPVIAITGQVSTAILGRDGFQETDIMGVTFPITKFNYMVKHPNELPSAFRVAHKVAMSGRPGPVLIDVPKDVQAATYTADEDVSVKVRLDKFVLPRPRSLDVKKAVEILLGAERPVILVGGGVYWSGAWNEVIKIAEILMAPIVSTFPGKNSVPNGHALYVGPAGMHGRLEADAALANADVILALGTRFSDRTVGRFNEMNEKKIIHIDIDSSEINKNVKSTIGVVSDVKVVLNEMLKIFPNVVKKNERFLNWLFSIRKSYENTLELLSNGMKFAPWKVLKTIRNSMPADSVTVTGVGSHQMWCELHWDVYVPGTFITSAGLGTMGFGLPAALGAKIAVKDNPVLLVDGDGSFQMTMNNLSLIRDYNLPIVIVIFDNRALMLVKQWQIYMYSKRIVETEFSQRPDFIKLVNAYDIEGYRPDSYNDIERIVKWALRNNEPVLIDVPIDREKDIVLPWVKPGDWLTSAIPPDGMKVDLTWRG
ncbi:MAG: biosynthetic-type acetolactate synthase large subunit [Thermoprotei archaeon]|jgi:acetolactate synthase-1/2/3 large subunit